MNQAKTLIAGKDITPFVSEIKPYTCKELSSFYQVDKKTFLKWLHPFRLIVGARQGRYYTVVQVEKIFDKLGMPYSIKDVA